MGRACFLLLGAAGIRMIPGDMQTESGDDEDGDSEAEEPEPKPRKKMKGEKSGKVTGRQKHRDASFFAGLL